MDNITANFTGGFTSLTMFKNLLLGQQLSQQLTGITTIFNIPSGLLGILLWIGTTMAMSLVIFLMFRSKLFATLAAGMTTWIFYSIGIIPIWISIFYSFISMYILFTTMYYIPATPETETIPVTEGSEWDEYGKRIKDAYTSKFGGENNGFNQEVDLRIEVMNHNGKGFTRTMAYDWLKRMARFTEAK